jgi:ABC-2 type transport system ATP-binding protein
VVLTTNYLDEAEALCDRVAILGSGRVLAEDTPAALTARTGRCLEIECLEEGARKMCAAIEKRRGVLRVELADFGLRVYLAAEVNPEDVVREARGICCFEGFRTRAPDLAEVFCSLSSGNSGL